MSEPDGPTGVITLKQVADMTYEQYGKIVLSATGLSQISISAQTFTDLFERQSMETQIVWLGEFQSRIQGTPNPNQSSSYNPDVAAWSGGAWGLGQNLISTEATLSGGVVSFLGAGSGYGQLATNESANLMKAISHVSYNPTFFMRWCQTGNGAGGMAGLGWIRQGESFRAIPTTRGAIYFRWDHDTEIIAVCAELVGALTVETTLGTGITAANGVYHTGRAVVTGGGTAVEFFMDAVSVGTITTNIPTEGGTFMLVPALGQFGGGSPAMILDYMCMSQQRSP